MGWPPYKGFSRRTTQQAIGKGITNYTGSSFTYRRRKARKNMRTNPKRSYVKSKRGVNKPNAYTFRGKNMTLHHTNLSRFNNKMLKGLTGTGILEKRMIPHRRYDYASAGYIAQNNISLKSSSAVCLNHSDTDPLTENTTLGAGIPQQFGLSSFKISGVSSRDRYVFYKNFCSEVTITTNVSTFTGVPDPTSAAQLGFLNYLNFRVLLLKCKPGNLTGNAFQGSPIPVQQPLLTNSLLLGYANEPYGFTRALGEQPITTATAQPCKSQDLQFGKINKMHWQVLQDKQFILSVPIANTAGSETKYPTMKKLTFNHPINEKVLVSNATQGTFPMDWDNKYMTVIIAGLPNSAAAVTTQGSSPPIPVPDTSRLWSFSTRGYTSYLDG